MAQGELRINGEDKLLTDMAANNAQISQLTDNGNITGFVVLTQTEYDALTTPDPTTVYIIHGA